VLLVVYCSQESIIANTLVMMIMHVFDIPFNNVTVKD